MKKHVLTETNNVKEVKRLIASFLGRTKSEQRGIALIYGDPGLGKTRMGERMAFNNQWLYLRMQANATSKWFLDSVYARVTKYVYGAPQVFKGTLADTEQAIINLLGEHPEIVMVIDEINLPLQFHKWSVVEMIRDFADLSFASFILIGEHDTKALIERYNKHFFDRCNFFYQFKKITIQDYPKLIVNSSDVEIDSDMIEWIYSETDGNLRKLGKLIERFESIAKSRNVKKLSKNTFTTGETNAE